MREEPPGGPERTSYTRDARLTTYEAKGFEQKREACLQASVRQPKSGAPAESERWTPHNRIRQRKREGWQGRVNG